MKIKMAMVLIFLSIVIGAFPFFTSPAEEAKHNYVPPSGYVPDEATAITIAEAVWLPIYGKEIYTKKPFRARLEDNVWIVEGSLPKVMPGGVPVAEINKKTGQIIRVSHGQ